MGGLSKKAYQFNHDRGAKGVHLTLDGGALLFKTDKLSPAQEAQAKVTATGIVKSYNLIRYDAVGVGPKDLAAGLTFLLDISKSSDFAWLSANLVSKLGQLPVFPASTILTAGSIKVGVIGLTGPKINPLILKENKLNILPWQEILPEIIKKLAPQSDMLILLSSYSDIVNKEIAARFQNIHIIIQANGTSANITNNPINNTLICQSGKQGKHIGILNVNWQPIKIWGSNSMSKLTKKKRNLDRVLWQLSKYNKYTDPLKDLKSWPTKLQSYLKLISIEKTLRAQIEKLTEEVDNRTAETEEPSTYSNRFLAMKTSLPDNKEVLAVVEEINKQIGEIGRHRAKAKTGIMTDYTGWQRCGQCHRQQLESWQKTRHAKAFSTLERVAKQFDLSCLPCHVTGITEQRANMALSLPKNLKDVGCESCHGPGRRHAELPKKYKLTTETSQETCLACHTDTHDDNFEYQRDIKLLH